MSRAEVARGAALGRQTLRDWVIRYNNCGVAGRAANLKGGGRPLLRLEEQAEVLAVVMTGPDLEKDSFSAFTRDYLVANSKTKFSKTCISRRWTGSRDS